MRIDTRKRVRHVAGENIVMMQGDGAADMTKVVGLNESSMLLHERLLGREFTVEDVAAVLTDEYEVDAATALKDAGEWVKSMKKEGLILD